jgi:hypothetical protein
MSDFVVESHLGILVGASEIQRNSGVIVKDIMAGVHQQNLTSFGRYQAKTTDFWNAPLKPLMARREARGPPPAPAPTTRQLI